MDVVSMDESPTNLYYTLHGTGWIPIAAGGSGFQLERRYTVRVEVQGVEIRACVDDVLAIDTDDHISAEEPCF